MWKFSKLFYELIQPGTCVTSQTNACKLHFTFSKCFLFYVTCFLINIHKDEWYRQQLACNVYLELWLKVALAFLILWIGFLWNIFLFRKYLNKKIKCVIFSIKLDNVSAFCIMCTGSAALRMKFHWPQKNVKHLIIAFFSPEIFHALNIQTPPEWLVGMLQMSFYCLLPMLDPIIYI